MHWVGLFKKKNGFLTLARKCLRILQLFRRNVGKSTKNQINSVKCLIVFAFRAWIMLQEGHRV